MSNINVNDVVVLSRAMFRGRFIVVGFKTRAERKYAFLVHESNPHENCHLLVSNLIKARGLIEVNYDPHLLWNDIMNTLTYKMRRVGEEWIEVHNGARVS